MKKVFYISALACCMISLTGCIQSKKMIGPGKDQSMEAPAKPGPGSSIGPVGTGQTGQQGQHLDISGGEDLTVDEITADTVIPSMEYVNDRIFEYGRKLERWKKLDNRATSAHLSQEETEQMVRCFRKLQIVLNGYTSLQEMLVKNSVLPEPVGITVDEMQELQKNDIAFLESPCGRLLSDSDEKGAGWMERSESVDLSQFEKLIERYSATREFEEVVQVWMQIPANQKDRVGLQTKLRYGNALIALHQEEQAARVYQQIVDEMSSSREQSTDLISLRKMLADLYTASGNYPMAEVQYNKIAGDYERLGEIEEWSKLQLSILARSDKGSPELKEYSSLLRNYLGFIPEKDGYKVVWQAEDFLLNYPYSAVSSNVDMIKNAAKRRADQWMADFLGRVDQLSGEKKFQEALDKLESIPTDLIGEDKRSAIKLKIDDLVLAEAVERETTKLVKVQDLQRKWNNGMLLVKGERFDEAIEVFAEMLDTEYRMKAEQKIDEVSLLAAKNQRRKAANLFIRFTKTTDFESQKKLLVESRNMLRGILVKYPDVAIAEKVRGNIERVEQEMNALDPSLLQMADSEDFISQPQRQDAFDIPTNSQPVSPIQQLPIIQQ